MKISIFVTYTFPYIGSGIGNVALKQAEELAGLGHDVTIVSSNFPNTKSEFVRNKVKHIKLSAIDILENIHVPVPLYIFNLKVINLIKSSDVIHVHDSVYPSSVTAIILGKLFNKKVILTQHVSYIPYPSRLINLVQKLAYLTIGNISFFFSDKILYFNPEVAKLVNNPGKLVFLSNGVDLELFHPAGKSVISSYRQKYNFPKNKIVVLFVGRLVPKKGYKLLFEARDSRYLIVFVGGGKVPEYMQNCKDVCFMPAQDQKVLSELYGLSDIFMLPSYGEGFPLSIQEAMASGLPVITNKENIFDKSIDCIKTISVSVENIRTSILELSQNNKLIQKMKIESRKYAENYYSWNINISNLMRIYQQN